MLENYVFYLVRCGGVYRDTSHGVIMSSRGGFQESFVMVVASPFLCVPDDFLRVILIV